jgi:hypothetical protein
MRASVFSLGKKDCWGCVYFGTIEKMMRVVNGDDVVSWLSIPVSSVSFQWPKSTRHAKVRVSVQYSWTRIATIPWLPVTGWPSRLRTTRVC